MTLMPNMFNEWLRTGATGTSSRAIVSEMVGYNVDDRWRRSDHPSDFSDFWRCEMLIRQHPILRLHMHKMRRVTPYWEALVDRWDDIVALAESEDPEAFTRRGRWCPLAYELMKEIEGAVRSELMAQRKSS